MRSTEEIATKSEFPKNGISSYKLHAFLQNDALTERITSELEQLNYAHILTSLAMGSMQNNNLSDGSTNQPEEKILTAFQRSDSVDSSTLNTANTEERSEFLRRQKRRVIPSRKIRELQEIHDVKRHGSYGNEFGRENGMKNNQKRKNKGKNCLVKRDVLSSNGLETSTAKDRKTPINSTGRFLRKTKKYAVMNDGGRAIQTGRKKINGKEINSKERSGENEGIERVFLENGTDLGANKNKESEEKFAEVKPRKSKEAMHNGGNKDATSNENYNETMEVKTKNSKEYNEDESSDEKTHYQCEQCGKHFKTYYTFSIHIRMPEHTKETPFVCDVCGKGFRLSSTLCRHKIIHTSNKPHECKICGKTFNRSSTLKMHMRTHSARKQHVCSTCGKGFHQKGNLRNHMFVHSGERPFCCETCGRHFNKKSNLKHHLRIHELNGKFSCTICKKVFEEHTGLKEHMQTKHVLL